MAKSSSGQSRNGQSRSSVTGKFVAGTYAAAHPRTTVRGMQAARVQFVPAPRSSSSQIKPPSGSSAADRLQ